MHNLRRAASARRSASAAAPEGHGIANHEARAMANRTPSLDTLVIRQRTRYPSDSPHQETTEPNAIDLSVAKALLAAKDRRSERSASEMSWQDLNRSTLPMSISAPAFQPNISEAQIGLTQERLRDISGSSSSSSNELEAEKNVLRYNQLAKRYGLQIVDSLEEDACSTETSLHTHRKTFMRYLRGSSSSSDMLKADKHLIRKRSVSKLMRKRSKLALNCQSLDQLYRLGGTSLLSLPKNLTATVLTIPCCLAATGNHLALHGPSTPGIFRIPGQQHAVNQLYDHYVAQMRNAVLEGDDVQDSIGYALLPESNSSYSIHDVASAFKRFLWDIPGGILGSPKLFQILRDIYTFDSTSTCNQTEWEFARPRLTALAFLGLRSRRRIALCAAVFGLLASIKCDKTFQGQANATSSGHKRQNPSQDFMSSRALGIIFAPTLLGERTNEIACASSTAEHHTSPKRGFIGHFRSPKRSSRSAAEQSLDVNASLDRSNAAASVIEILLKDWEAVARCMTSFQGSSSTTSLVSQLRTRHAHAFDPRFFRTLTPIASPGSRTGTPRLVVSEQSPVRKTLVESEELDPGGRRHPVDNAGRPSLHPSAAEFPDRSSDRYGTSSQPARRAFVAQDAAEAWWEGSPKTPARLRSRRKAGSDVTDHRRHGTVHDANVTNSYSKTTENTLPKSSPGPTIVRSSSADQELKEATNLSQPTTGDAVQSVDSGTEHGRNDSPTCHELQANLQCQLRLISELDDRERMHAEHTYSHSEPRAIHHTNPVLAYEGGRGERSSPCVSSSSPVANQRHRGRWQWGGGQAQLGKTTTPTITSKSSKLSLLSTKPALKLGKHQHDTKNAGAASRPSNSPVLLYRETNTENEPPIARHLNFRPVGENVRPPNADAAPSDPFLARNRGNVGTLYAEIGRLKQELDVKNESILQLQQELSAIRYARDTATLSEKLRESERELRIWRHRAQWAETALFRRSRNRTDTTEASE